MVSKAGKEFMAMLGETSSEDWRRHKVKNYDYWLIIWKRGTERIHNPTCFDVGVHPDEYCKTAIEQMKNPYDGYECYRLIRAI